MVTITVLSGSPLATVETLEYEVSEHSIAHNVFGNLIRSGHAWKLAIEEGADPYAAVEWYRTEQIMIIIKVARGNGKVVINGKVIKRKFSFDQLLKKTVQTECGISAFHDDSGVATVEITSIPEETKPKRKQHRGPVTKQSRQQ